MSSAVSLATLENLMAALVDLDLATREVDALQAKATCRASHGAGSRAQCAGAFDLGTRSRHQALEEKHQPLQL